MRDLEPRLLIPPTAKDRRIDKSEPKRYSIPQGGVYFLFTAIGGIGLAAGLAGRDAFENDTTPPPATSQSRSWSNVEISPQPYQIIFPDKITVDLADKGPILVAIATAVPTELATATPGVVPTSTPLSPVCSETPQPGTTCARPTQVPNTPTPYPDCNEVLPTPAISSNMLCTWATEASTQPGREVPQGVEVTIE